MADLLTECSVCEKEYELEYDTHPAEYEMGYLRVPAGAQLLTDGCPHCGHEWDEQERTWKEELFFDQMRDAEEEMRSFSRGRRALYY